MPDMETWRDVPGYEGLYKVSDVGRIMALTFTNNQCTGKPRNHIMKPFDNGHGYLVVSLTAHGKRKNHYIHRLVALVFVDNPNGFTEVNHKDHNRQNNSVGNLEWCSRAENVRYSASCMKHQKSASKKTRTGEKYIHKRNGRFRVAIKQLKIDRSFATLDEAILFRNGVMS